MTLYKLVLVDINKQRESSFTFTTELTFDEVLISLQTRCGSWVQDI